MEQSKKRSMVVEKIDLDSGFEQDLQGWLCRQAHVHKPCWLLAHAYDGVIWGKIGTEEPEKKGIFSRLVGNSKPAPPTLKLSHDAFPTEDVLPLLSLDTLEQLRLFSEQGELLIWRTDSGWSARLLEDHSEVDKLSEAYLLWGNCREEIQDDFSLLSEGAEGLFHAPPVDIEEKMLPLQLRVHHYIDYDGDGQAYIVASRLVGLEDKSGQRLS